MFNPYTRFIFQPQVLMQEAEGTLRLAQLAAQSLHGAERVELETRCHTDRQQRSVTIDTGTEAGRTLALIFLGYVRREFGAEAVQIQQSKGPAAIATHGLDRNACDA